MKLIGTILTSDPYDERDGAYMDAKEWKEFDKLPPGTKIYAKLPGQQLRAFDPDEDDPLNLEIYR